MAFIRHYTVAFTRVAPSRRRNLQLDLVIPLEYAHSIPVGFCHTRGVDVDDAAHRKSHQNFSCKTAYVAPVEQLIAHVRGWRLA